MAEMSLSRMGRTEASSASKKRLRWTMSLFLPESGTCLLTSLRRANLRFRSLCVSQPVSVMLPLRTFETHSLIQINFLVTVRYDDYAVLAGQTWACEERGNLTLFVSLFISAYIVGGSTYGKMQVRNLRRSCLSYDRSNNWYLLARSDTPSKSGTVFGIKVSRQIAELIFKTELSHHYFLCVQRDIVIGPPLMKEVLGNLNDTDIPVMAAFRK